MLTTFTLPENDALPTPTRRHWLKRLGASQGRAALADPTQVAGSSPYLGEIMLAGWPFATLGWLICDGSLVSISDYEALFTLIGTTYGGNGRTNFALPGLRGRAPKHTGQGAGLSAYSRGQQGGSENPTLTTATMPARTHSVTGETVAVLAYTNASTGTEAAGALTNTGSGQAISLRPGQLAMNYQICVGGIFPTSS